MYPYTSLHQFIQQNYDIIKLKQIFPFLLLSFYSTLLLHSDYAVGADSHRTRKQPNKAVQEAVI